MENSNAQKVREVRSGNEIRNIRTFELEQEQYAAEALRGMGIPVTPLKNGLGSGDMAMWGRVSDPFRDPLIAEIYSPINSKGPKLLGEIIASKLDQVYGNPVDHINHTDVSNSVGNELPYPDLKRALVIDGRKAGISPNDVRKAVHRQNALGKLQGDVHLIFNGHRGEPQRQTWRAEDLHRMKKTAIQRGITTYAKHLIPNNSDPKTRLIPRPVAAVAKSRVRSSGNVVPVDSRARSTSVTGRQFVKRYIQSGAQVTTARKSVPSRPVPRLASSTVKSTKSKPMVRSGFVQRPFVKNLVPAKNTPARLVSTSTQRPIAQKTPAQKSIAQKGVASSKVVNTVKPIAPVRKLAVNVNRPKAPVNAPRKSMSKPVTPAQRPPAKNVVNIVKPVAPAARPPVQKPIAPAQRPPAQANKPVTPAQRPPAKNVVNIVKPVAPAARPPVQKPIAPAQRPPAQANKPVTPAQRPPAKNVVNIVKPVAPAARPPAQANKPVTPAQRPPVQNNKPVVPAPRPPTAAPVRNVPPPKPPAPKPPAPKSPTPPTKGR